MTTIFYVLEGTLYQKIKSSTIENINKVVSSFCLRFKHILMKIMINIITTIRHPHKYFFG
jgi:hypothetical protein